MRYHVFKSSASKNIILGDSQIKHLNFPNFNILSLPGAQIRHLSEFFPPAHCYDRIVIIGGNDLFKGDLPSAHEPHEVAEELNNLANELVPLANKKVYVIGIPNRGDSSDNKKWTQTTNNLIQKYASRASRVYRSISHKVYNSQKHISNDNVHLNQLALSNLGSILKHKILTPVNFSTALNVAGHLQEFQCERSFCKCGCFNPTY